MDDLNNRHRRRRARIGDRSAELIEKSLAEYSAGIETRRADPASAVRDHLGTLLALTLDIGEQLDGVKSPALSARVDALAEAAETARVCIFEAEAVLIEIDALRTKADPSRDRAQDVTH